MKKLLYTLIVALLIISCQDNGSGALHAPSNIANVTARPDTGAAVISWDMPPDSSYLYLEVSYDKYPDDPDTTKMVPQKVSRYTDSVVVDGLLNKYNYKFHIQPFNANPDNKEGGKVLTTNSVQPIRRTIDTTYSLGQQITVDTSMVSNRDIDVDYSGHSGKNLFDNDVSTFWQTSWYYNPHNPPFYTTINFNQKVSIGAIKYKFRDTGDLRAFPTQFGIATSEDGTNWKQVWQSDADLPVKPRKEEKSLLFDQNYTSKHFRVMMLATHAGVKFGQFADLKLYKTNIETTDEEKIAEENY